MEGTSAIKLMTVAEFFDFEDASVEKHEFFQGRVFAMAGGTLRHSQIKVNLIRELSQFLRGKPCKPFDADLRIRIVKNGLITYPDASIVCGKPEIDKQDRHAINNPAVIFEVVSPNTEHYDRGSKFAFYKELPSLREYVIITQDEPGVEVYRRNEKGEWVHSAFIGLKAAAVLKTASLKLPLSALYEDVEFETQSKPSPLIVLGRPKASARTRRKKTP